jgi:methionyl-tRNA formyltransferase
MNDKLSYIIFPKGDRGLGILNECIKRKLIPTAIVLDSNNDVFEAIAKEHNIEVRLIPWPKKQEQIDWVKSKNIDLGIAAGYGKMIPESMIQSAKMGFINTHGGKLPEFAGASPIVTQLIHGATKGCAYVLKMTAGVDDGPVLAFQDYEISKEENATTLTHKINEIYLTLMPDIIEKFANGETLPESPHPEGKRRVFTRRVPDDGNIDWKSLNASEVVNLTRALTSPYPGAFTYFNHKKIIIHKAIIHPTEYCGIAGRYVGKREGYPTIIAKDRGVALLDFSYQGEPLLDFPSQYGENAQINYLET